MLPPNVVFYRADKENNNTKGWKPSIHMLKEAACIRLMVKSIQRERLQDISAHGIEKECISMDMLAGADPHLPYPERLHQEWKNLRQSINRGDSCKLIHGYG